MRARGAPSPLALPGVARMRGGAAPDSPLQYCSVAACRSRLIVLE